MKDIIKIHYFIAFLIGTYFVSFQYQEVNELAASIGDVMRRSPNDCGNISFEEIEAFETKIEEYINGGKIELFSRMKIHDDHVVVEGAIVNNSPDTLFHVESNDKANYYNPSGYQVFMQNKIDDYKCVAIAPNDYFMFTQDIGKQEMSIYSMMYHLSLSYTNASTNCNNNQIRSFNLRTMIRNTIFNAQS